MRTRVFDSVNIKVKNKGDVYFQKICRRITPLRPPSRIIKSNSKARSGVRPAPATAKLSSWLPPPQPTPVTNPSSPATPQPTAPSSTQLKPRASIAAHPAPPASHARKTFNSTSPLRPPKAAGFASIPQRGYPLQSNIVVALASLFRLNEIFLFSTATLRLGEFLVMEQTNPSVSKHG